ncbi:MAG TPA: ABC transporter permease subunit, partial [Flavobacterium sp.]|nr:ABC transporter permease subunit [Flavobacterium sp.]
ALGHSKTIYNIFEPLVDFVRSIPVIALFPLFLLFFSIGDPSKIAMVAFTSGLVITLNTMYGVHHSNKTRSLLAKTLGASQFMIIRKVEFFEALPYIFTGFRLAISFSLVVVIFTEMLLAFTDYGLGLRIYDAYQVRNVSEMYALIVLSGLVGYIFNVGMKTMEKRVVHWTGKS